MSELTAYQRGWIQGKCDILTFLQVSTLTPQEYLDACEQEYQEDVQDSLEKNDRTGVEHREFLSGNWARQQSDLAVLIERGVYKIEDGFQSGEQQAQSDLDNFWNSNEWHGRYREYHAFLLETAQVQFRQFEAAEIWDMAWLNCLAGYITLLQEKMS